MIKIIGIATWRMDPMTRNMGNPNGQVKHCLYQEKIEFYVRENIIAEPPPKRWQMLSKRRSYEPDVRRVLELFAPNPCWYDISRLVHYEDPLKRPVERNFDFDRRFIAGLKFSTPEDKKISE